MFLSKLLALMAFFSINAFSKPVMEDEKERTPKDIVADYKHWKTVKFVKGGISFKIPKEFIFESDEPNPEKDIAVLTAYHQKKDSKLHSLMVYFFRYPRGDNDPYVDRDPDEYINSFFSVKQPSKSESVVFNKKEWRLVNVRHSVDKKVSKQMFHKIHSKNKAVNGRFLRLELVEHNNVEVCLPKQKPPCGPLTDKFYSWPIIEKILESVEYIE